MFEKIKAVFKAARLRRDTIESRFYSTVIGDIQLRAEKEGCKEAPTDAVVLAVYKSYIKRYDAEIAEGRQTMDIVHEKAMLAELMPAQASEEEVAKFIANVAPVSMKEMGKVMGALKANFDDVDGAIVRRLFEAYING